MGDFNSQPYSVPVALLKNYAGLRDAFQEVHPGCDEPAPAGLSAENALTTLGMTCDSPLNSWSAGKPIPASVLAQGGKRLDYVFYGAPEGRAPLRCTRADVTLTDRIDGGLSYSDHFGLAVTFAAGGAGGAGAGGEGGDEHAGQHNAQRETHPLAHVPYSDDDVPADVGGHGGSAAAQSVRKALAVMREYYPEATRRAKAFVEVTVACVLLEIALAVGSAWQPKSWIQPIFTVAAFVLGIAGATALYVGWLWGRWEKGLLDECVAQMEEELLALRG